MSLHEIELELRRLGATDATARMNAEFEPEAGDLVKFELKGAYWHLGTAQFLALLKDLPDDAGSEAIRATIELNAMPVWHGPAPKGSRDTSP